MNLPTIGTSFASGKRSHLAIPAMIVRNLTIKHNGVTMRRCGLVIKIN